MPEKLDKKARQALPDSDFAVPGKRMLPIHDATHVKLAWDMVDRAKDLTDEERTKARSRILRRASSLGVDTKSWKIHAASDGRLTFAATLEQLFVAEADPAHPNKHYFKGIMTRVDEASDNPPGGANGKPVLLPSTVAESALDTLIGMGVDHTPNFDGHDKQNKIGIIERGWIEGSALWIEGFFYAADFPDEVKRIELEQASMGFSYELQAHVQDVEATPLVITACIFTGCAVLYKDKAAYSTTSITAQADMEIDMTLEEMQAAVKDAVNAAVEAQVKPLAAQIAQLQANGAGNQIDAASVLATVKPHADALRACAASMEAAGIGGHAKRGHVAHLNDIADHMEAEAALGKMPHIVQTSGWYDASAMQAAAQQNAGNNAATAPAVDTKALMEGIGATVKELVAAAVDPLATQMKDLQAKAFNQAEPPERKTVAPEIMALVARAGLTLPEKGEASKLTYADVSAAGKKAGFNPQQRIALKHSLEAAGLIADAPTAE